MNEIEDLDSCDPTGEGFKIQNVTKVVFKGRNYIEQRHCKEMEN